MMFFFLSFFLKRDMGGDENAQCIWPLLVYFKFLIEILAQTVYYEWYQVRVKQR